MNGLLIVKHLFIWQMFIEYQLSSGKMFIEYQLSSGKNRVSIADESHISISKKGSISLFAKYNIWNILYISDFLLNLLSISKITKEFNCELTFSINCCVMQDLDMGKRFRIGLVFYGLYTFLVKVTAALISAMKEKMKKKTSQQLIMKWY